MYEYALDLETLLSLLVEVHQDGILSTVFSAGFLEWKGRCSIEIHLVQGKITYCHVEDGKGSLYILEPARAFKTLNSLGVLDWQFTNKGISAPSARPSQPSNVSPPAFSSPPYSAPQNSFEPTNKQGSNVPLDRSTDPLQASIRSSSGPLGSPSGPLGSPSGPLRSIRNNASSGNTTPLPRSRSDGPFSQHFPRDSSPFQNMAVLIPKLRVNVDAQMLNSLPRKNRRVLVLIDGVRSIEVINSILYPSSQDINAIIDALIELQKWGIITIEK